jgi:hypothetical protein
MSEYPGLPEAVSAFASSIESAFSRPIGTETDRRLTAGYPQRVRMVAWTS